MQSCEVCLKDGHLFCKDFFLLKHTKVWIWFRWKRFNTMESNDRTCINYNHDSCQNAGFHTCVSLHMFIKVLLHVEIFPTPLAHELLVSDMDAHVWPQLIFVLEPFTAILQNAIHLNELIKDIVCMNRKVRMLWTHLTFEGFFSRMLKRVHFKRHATLEGLPTCLTGEGHVLGVSWGSQKHWNNFMDS